MLAGATGGPAVGPTGVPGIDPGGLAVRGDLGEKPPQPTVPGVVVAALVPGHAVGERGDVDGRLHYPEFAKRHESMGEPLRKG